MDLFQNPSDRIAQAEKEDERKAAERERLDREEEERLREEERRLETPTMPGSPEGDEDAEGG